MKLSEFFNIKEEYNLTPEKIRYYSSLVPEKEVLLNCKKIFFNVNLFPPSNQKMVKYENSVNIHLFKPKFFKGNCDSLICFVPSKDVLNHTLRAFYLIGNLIFKTDPMVEITNYPPEYQKIIKKWDIKGLVLIGRTETVINFLKLIYLIEQGYPLKEIKELFINLELLRLPHERGVIKKRIKRILDKNNIKLEDINKKFLLRKLYSSSIYIRGFNFKYKGKEVTCIQLPWGFNLSREITEHLFNKKRFKKVAIVGGVGYVGNSFSKIKIDDIFIPERIIYGNDKIGYRCSEIPNNALFERNELFKFENKKEVYGTIKTVITKRGSFSNSKDIRKGIQNGLIDALDMEAAGFLGIVKRFPHTKLFSCYYIMDNPRIGIGLGDTYYNEIFLRRLFSTYERGKYVCLEKALNFLIR